MTRFTSQLIFCSPEQILRRSVVEIDNQNRINAVFSLDDHPSESSHTIFVDGIISPGFFSLKNNLSADKLKECVKEYNYVDLSVESPVIKKIKAKPLILDFSSDSTEIAAKKIKKLSSLLDAFSTFEIIAGCVYYPAVLSGIQNTLTVNNTTRILLWENTNLVEKKLTSESSVKLLF